MITHYFSNIDLPKLREICPLSSTLSKDMKQWAILDWCWRNLYWTGVNNPPLTGGAESHWNGILDWFIANQNSNTPAPAWSCGTIANFYVSICAAYGIPARKICASDWNGTPDHTAEFWSYQWQKWVHVLTHSNGYYKSNLGVPMSYREWASISRKDREGHYEFYSPTGGHPFHKPDSLQQFYAWKDFTCSAFVINGNFYNIQPNSNLLKLVKIYDDPAGKSVHPNACIGDTTPETLQDIYPILCPL